MTKTGKKSSLKTNKQCSFPRTIEQTENQELVVI